MLLIRGLIGAALMTMGRKLFTFFVAGIGFLVGLDLAQQIFTGGPDWLVLGIAVLAALVVALLVNFVKGVAVGLAGFIGGGYALVTLAGLIGLVLGGIFWIVFVVGGIVGVILAYALLDWTLIIISSVVGSILVVEALTIPEFYRLFAFLFLAIIGILIQARMLKKK